ncbi:Molecular chaperone DnaK (HSP70) [Desulfocicer vacuolatum DSM 3385]|uniref:Molecular chaperone DnaK (HSP70) n=1 Tax=Desulfocicer vacuolatum DSM 3385 TaxID=1121400 RepID=A0A1W2EVD1_9BACT|nr:Hsp70 family protein [Desulfocicer vacuolatum]SMD13118.1 Molecular chaperone DnaK (HSP70) [Desulfocicer vacuolatum DSM 3385]
MDFQDKRYVVGIDLGTTNSAVSFVDLATLSAGDKKRPIKMFKVPQLTGAGEFTPVPVLPSFLYIPGEYDISRKSLKHPWKREKDQFVGVFARDHGGAVPSRLVSSAKSWLCHARADRQAKILPWGAQGVEKISPVETTAEFLRHIKKSWNHFVKDEDLFLENQFTVITVPASFDEEAREFTLEAARMAGLGNRVTLLEEPLAAFYAWLIRHEHDWQQFVKPDDLILVCDVGGGTTDFTLITLKASQGSPRFERLAVGDHLILGGDNIDLALARYVESQFSQKSALSGDKWKTLCHKCRSAKEQILEKGEERVRITLKGEGRSLIAGTLAADLTRDAVKNILCNGFFPDVTPETDARKKKGKAMAEFGLPYEQEPAITRHIGWFLEKHRQDVIDLLGKPPIPDLILFNGGSLKPSLLQDRTRSAIRSWFAMDDDTLPGVLENGEPDLSVALGASYYGLVKQGTGVRVGSGSPRSYYIGIAAEERRPDAGVANPPLESQDVTVVDGAILNGEFANGDGSFAAGNHGGHTNGGGTGNSARALCVVERGLDEGSTIVLPQMSFEVLTNQPVSFDMFSSSFRSGDRSGDVVVVDDTLTPMTPLQTVIRFGKKDEKRRIPVTIEPEYTELGTLAMWCKSCISSHRWKLQFQLRDVQGVLETRETEVFDEDQVARALKSVTSAFSNKQDIKKVQQLTKSIESILGQKKGAWSLSFLRRMADVLIERSETRKLSPAHEVKWLNLMGFCIRPGFGDAFDEERVRKLWKIYLGGLIFPKSRQNAVDWWIFCRRIAGGLTAGQQRQFFQDISSLVSGGSAAKKMPPQEMTEMWMAAANMERLLVKDKVVLGRKLLNGMKPAKTPRQHLWAVSRLGARELLYGSVDRVISAREVGAWVQKLMKMSWTQKEPVVLAVAQMVRKTDDRTRDLSREMVDDIFPWFENMGAGKEAVAMVKQAIPIESREESQIYGESLPQGLILTNTK